MTLNCKQYKEKPSGYMMKCPRYQREHPFSKMPYSLFTGLGIFIYSTHPHTVFTITMHLCPFHSREIKILKFAVFQPGPLLPFLDANV